MYRIQGIILYKQIIRDNHVRTVLFSQEYGKITLWEKGQSGGDTGSIVEVILERKNGQNTVKKMSIIEMLHVDGWSYEDVVEYLYMIKILYMTLPEGSEQRNIYDDVSMAIMTLKSGVGKVGIIVYLQARILKILGYLSQEDASLLGKSDIIDSLNRRSIKGMLSTLSFTPEDVKSLKMQILRTEHAYLFNS